MQKVVGSSPIIRSQKKPAQAGLFFAQTPEPKASRSIWSALGQPSRRSRDLRINAALCRPVMLAGIPVDAATTAELTTMVRAAGADELPERLEQALDDGVALLALTIDERAVIRAALEDPPLGLAEVRGVLVNEHRRTPWLCS